LPVSVIRIARAALEILRLTIARERLGGELAPAPAGSHRPRRLLRLLFAIEPLPLDPPAPSRRRGSLLAALLTPEPLPRDPVASAPSRRRSRLAALFAPEKLDP